MPVRKTIGTIIANVNAIPIDRRSRRTPVAPATTRGQASARSISTNVSGCTCESASTKARSLPRAARAPAFRAAAITRFSARMTRQARETAIAAVRSVETCQLPNQALALLYEMIELRVAARNGRRIRADLLEYSISLASEIGPDRLPRRALLVQQCIHRVSSSNIVSGVHIILPQACVPARDRREPLYSETSLSRVPRQ